MNVCIVCVNVRRKRNVHSECACRMSSAPHTHTHVHHHDQLVCICIPIVVGSESTSNQPYTTIGSLDQCAYEHIICIFGQAYWNQHRAQSTAKLFNQMSNTSHRARTHTRTRVKRGCCLLMIMMFTFWGPFRRHFAVFQRFCRWYSWRPNLSGSESNNIAFKCKKIFMISFSIWFGIFFSYAMAVEASLDHQQNGFISTRVIPIQKYLQNWTL